MSDARIQAFRDALAEGDHAAAVEGFDAFADALAAQDRREGALRPVARGVNARTGDDAATQTAQEYLEVVGNAQHLRLQAKFDFMLYLEGGPAAADIADKVDAVLTAHDAADAAAADLRAHADGIDLPPQLGVFGPDSLAVPKGTTIDATYTVENVGTVGVDALDVTVEGYDLAVSPDSISGLAPTATADVAVSGSAAEAGEFPVVLKAAGETASASRRVSLAVLDTDAYLERALTTIGDLRDQLAEGDAQGGGDGKGNDDGGVTGLEKKLDTAEQRIERIRDALGGGNGKGNGGNGGNSLDQRIGAVANLVEAFGNQARGLGGGPIPERRAAMLAADADQLIDLLERAIEAAR
jgi:HAMP domain-containing protein